MGLKISKIGKSQLFQKKLKKFNLNKRANIYLTKFVELKNPNGLNTIP